MKRKAVLERVRAELERAERARSENNEGRARVCARRAAGWAVGFFFSQKTEGPTNRDALKLLERYRDLEGAPENLRAAAGRLTARVTRDHRLPHRADPLADARRIVRGLLESAPVDRDAPVH
jgi:hypothetical protein